MWCWRRMEKISWTDHVWNEDVLLRVKEQRNIVHEIRKRKANWIGHILRRNCLLQWFTEGKIQGGIEVTGIQGRRRSKLLDDLKERRGYSHLKEEALDRSMWRARFGRGFEPVVRQTTKWMNTKFFQKIPSLMMFVRFWYWRLGSWRNFLLFFLCSWIRASYSIIHKENPTRCNSVSKFLFHTYMKLNTFRATHRPSSGA